MIKPSPHGDNEKGQSRYKLLEAATELFSEKGFHAVSVKDICTRAKVNVSSISYHFGGKEGLLNALLESMVRGHKIEPLPEDVGSPGEFRERLENFLNGLVEFYQRNPPLVRLFFQELDYGLPEAEKIFANIFERLAADFKRFIETGRQKGYLRDSQIRTEVILLQLVAPISELVRRDHMAERFYGVNLRDHILRETLVPSLVAGILSSPNYVN